MGHDPKRLRDELVLHRREVRGHRPGLPRGAVSIPPVLESLRGIDRFRRRAGEFGYVDLSSSFCEFSKPGL